MRAALAMAPALVPFVFGPDELARLGALLDLDPSSAVTSWDELSPERRQSLELLIVGWGVPELDDAELDRLPNLRAIVHWGGGLGFLSKSVAERGIVVSTARDANAIPVAEFTVAMIVLASKDVPWISRLYGREQRVIDREAEFPATGLNGTAVGVLGAGSIGALVCEMLRPYDVRVMLNDPHVSSERAQQLGAELVDDLRDLARRSTILTVHAPESPQTRGLVSRSILASMPDGATLINTSRGSLIDQTALVEELSSGRLRAILDVTEPEVLPSGHPFYILPNVFLTPHLAGSMGNELRRLGDTALAEIERFVAGQSFLHPKGP